MKRFLTVFVVTLVLSNGAGLPAQTRAEGEKLLEAARRTAVIEGDPEKAIEQYRRIAERFKDQPAVAASARLQMAQHQETLGLAQARQTYGRVAKDYADTPYAASARARLTELQSLQNSSTASLGVATREIDVTDDVIYAISSDGRYAYGPNKGIQELLKGTSRLLETGKYGEGAVDTGAFSKDGKQFAYLWWKPGSQSPSEVRVTDSELRVVGSETASGVARYKTLFKDSSLVSVHDWTPDGKSVVVCLARKAGTYEVGMISVEDGTYRHLFGGTKRSRTWPGGLRVNPLDGRYIAFDFPADSTVSQRDVFVLAIDGNSREPTRMVSEPTNDNVVGWSPDGTQLIFASQRASGETDLRALPLGGGKATGAPTVVRRNIEWPFDVFTITRSGALYYTFTPPARFRIANVDLSAERLAPSALTGATEIVGLWPQFSPDGKDVAYATPNSARIGIRSLDSSNEHIIDIAGLERIFGPRWSADGLTLIAKGTDFQGAKGIYRIEVATHRASLLLANCDCDGPALSPDGKRLYFARWNADPPSTVLVERDLASGNDRDLLLIKSAISSYELSPDARYIAVGASGKVMVIPASGGEARELVQAGSFQGWAPDSRSILVSGQGRSYMVSLEGTSRRTPTLDGLGDQRVFRPGGLNVVLSPDGRHIAFQETRPEPIQPIHVIENFLPGKTVPPGNTVAKSTGPIRQLTWVDRTGKQIEKVGPPAEYTWRFYTARALSPDGKRLAVPRPGSEGDDLWILDLGSGTMTREVSDIYAGEGSLAWSADSNRIAFVRQRPDRSELYVKRVDGTSKEALRWETPNRIWGPTWSPDGTLIVVGVTALRPLQPQGDYDHWAVPVTGDRAPFPLPWNTPRNDGLAAISPDGRSIAFNRSREGATTDYDIYVRSFPDGEREWPIPNGAGVRPAWRQDGKELYFSGGGSLKAVDVRVNGSTVQFGAPQALAVPDTALTLDGKRFLVLEDVAATKP